MSEHKFGVSFKGRVFLSGEAELYPGWHLQYYVDGEAQRKALWIYDSDALIAAVTAAAEFLDCTLEEIQVEGEDWPLNSESSSE